MTERKYQVFISSTFTDLRDERRSIMEVILAMGHIPAGMELFSAGNQEQWELIKERIEECDYYIVVIAQRYGSVTNEGISYTRKEYEFARSIGIPLAGFILHPDVAKLWPMHKCDPENATKLDEFKRLIQSLPIEYWTDAGDLKARCAVALPKLIRKNPRPGWISGDQGLDTGLATELARLSAENEVLRTKVTELRDALEATIPRDDLEELALEMQAKRFKLLVRFDWEHPEEECEEVDLMGLFLAAAPSMLIENSARDVQDTFLNTSGRVVAHRQSRKTAFGIRLNESVGDSIIGELANRGLVEPSIKKRSLNSHHNFWKLTRLGSQLYKHAAAMQTQ